MKKQIFFLLFLFLLFGVNGQIIQNKVLFEELSPSEFREIINKTPVAYLPLGTLEWHGEHLPLGSDGLQSKGFFEILAKEVCGVVLPMYFLGPDSKRIVNGEELIGMDFYSAKDHGNPEQKLDGSAYWISDTLFLQIVDATLTQLKRAGFKIVVYHGHGPSTSGIQKKEKELEEKYGLKLFNCWIEGAGNGYGLMTDHAAMNETSLIMALYPELVQMENLPADTTKWPMGVMGNDPRIYASPEVGNKSIKMVKDGMINILKKALAEL
ncbi:MAG: creatininase family protein [Mariniphaga sp.]|nr:creatininase family protein [Mariniphaga sp.]